ncbi:hypothetical protein L1987_15337 [Smallanthus sonchifolius]|uniref:Uncharacterized protein n=1 Tax=Smallanthus sonchifolius TaxID=185202 RepID=A0ACB9J641_9ASTR|nr:hypothetical protein L1987_15337 [Smallanthus sonchifolius]
MNEKVVGIDLGTTNSAMAAMEGGQLTIITNAEVSGADHFEKLKLADKDRPACGILDGMQQSSQDSDSASWEYSESRTRVGAVFKFQKKSEDYFCSKVFL